NILYKEYIEEEKKVNNNKKDFNFSILNILIINYFFSIKDIISHINLIDEKYYKLKKNEYLAYKNKKSEKYLIKKSLNEYILYHGITNDSLYKSRINKLNSLKNKNDIIKLGKENDKIFKQLGQNDKINEFKTYTLSKLKLIIKLNYIQSIYLEIQDRINNTLNLKNKMDYTFLIYTQDNPSISTMNFYLEQYIDSYLDCCVRLTSKEYFLFFDKNISSSGKDFLLEILFKLELILLEYEKENGVSLFEKYKRKYQKKRNYLYLGESIDYSYLKNPNLFEEYIELLRKAENIIWHRGGLPKIGEGWISETRLYYDIKNKLNNLKVIHHAYLKFLGRQHIDIYIPKLKIGIEYQGLQHDKPIEFFGGQKAFEQTKERDKKKYELCKKNNVKIIYVKEGYDINKIMKNILN
ncbi:MAG: hypothetical protein KAT05_15280, partial [Spirochaetes bacterium]|nr:hypothetical protein [Spirochaetota bacterium]